MAIILHNTGYDPLKKWHNAGGADYTPPMGYAFIAMDTEVKSFSVPTNLAYGVNGVFFYKKNVQGTITFDNATFGDPVKYVRKGGFAEITVATQAEIDKMAADKLATSGMSATTKWLLYGGIGAVVLIMTALIIRMARKKK